MNDVSRYLNQGKRLFGFTRTGASVVGKLVRQVLARRQIRQIVGMGLVAVLTFTFLVHNLANIGGSSVLAINLVNGTPNPTIDASTKYTVRLPIDYQYESRGFSWYHAGVDLVTPTGTPVRPIMVGIVEAVNHDYFGYGNHVIVAHEDGYKSIYGHLSLTEVKPGQRVELSTELGKSGSTGFSTGPHLHLEIHKDGVTIDPAEIVPGVR